MKKRVLTYFIGLGMALFLASCTPRAPSPEKRKVLVSIPPYHFLAKEIGKDFLEVVSIVPPNANPHLFEPTPKQRADLAGGIIWFQIGEPFEQNIAHLLIEQNPRLILSDLREGIELLTDSCCPHSSEDRHIWLNPKLLLLQAENMERIFTAQWPEHKETFQKNLDTLRKRLHELDRYMRSTLAPLQKRTFLVSHPAFGYFCKEYHFEQISVEFEGKEPLPHHLKEVVEMHIRSSSKLALALPQHSNKGTELIADRLDLSLHRIDPYSYDYFELMDQLTHILVETESR